MKNIYGINVLEGKELYLNDYMSQENIKSFLQIFDGNLDETWFNFDNSWIPSDVYKTYFNNSTITLSYQLDEEEKLDVWSVWNQQDDFGHSVYDHFWHEYDENGKLISDYDAWDVLDNYFDFFNDYFFESNIDVSTIEPPIYYEEEPFWDFNISYNHAEGRNFISGYNDLNSSDDYTHLLNSINNDYLLRLNKDGWTYEEGQWDPLNWGEEYEGYHFYKDDLKDNTNAEGYIIWVYHESDNWGEVRFILYDYNRPIELSKKSIIDFRRKEYLKQLDYAYPTFEYSFRTFNDDLSSNSQIISFTVFLHENGLSVFDTSKSSGGGGSGDIPAFNYQLSGKMKEIFADLDNNIEIFENGLSNGGGGGLALEKAEQNRIKFDGWLNVNTDEDFQEALREVFEYLSNKPKPFDPNEMQLKDDINASALFEEPDGSRINIKLETKIERDWDGNNSNNTYFTFSNILSDNLTWELEIVNIGYVNALFVKSVKCLVNGKMHYYVPGLIRAYMLYNDTQDWQYSLSSSLQYKFKDLFDPLALLMRGSNGGSGESLSNDPYIEAIDIYDGVCTATFNFISINEVEDIDDGESGGGGEAGPKNASYCILISYINGVSLKEMGCFDGIYSGDLPVYQFVYKRNDNGEPDWDQRYTQTNMGRLGLDTYQVIMIPYVDLSPKEFSSAVLDGSVPYRYYQNTVQVYFSKPINYVTLINEEESSDNSGSGGDDSGGGEVAESNSGIFFNVIGANKNEITTLPVMDYQSHGGGEEEAA